MFQLNLLINHQVLTQMLAHPEPGHFQRRGQYGELVISMKTFTDLVTGAAQQFGYAPRMGALETTGRRPAGIASRGVAA